MLFEKLYINEALTNGMIDDLKADPSIIGFVISALDHGFKVSKEGASIMLTYGRIKIGRHLHPSEDAQVWIYRTPSHGEGFIKIWKLTEFDFTYVELNRGSFFYDGVFICKTS